MKYQKKPEIIEAVQWTGSNIEEVKAFVGDAIRVGLDSDKNQVITISTYKGPARLDIGDYIKLLSKMPKQFYPCRASAFESKYEPYEEEV